MNLFTAGLVVWAHSLTATVPDDSASRAADAAERAAAAAERSAAAAERAAIAIERLALPPPPPAPVSAAAAAAAKTNPWTLTAGLGLISITGNATTITATANVAAQCKAEKWILNLRANGAYGQSQPTVGVGVPQILALSALFAGQVDYRFSDRLSAFIRTGVDTDHVKSVELRGFGEAGVGIIWLDTKEGSLQRSFLTTDIGFRYQREQRFQYFPLPLDLPDVDLVSPRVAGTFRYALNKQVLFEQNLEIMPNILGASRVLVNSLSQISARLFSVFSIGLGFAVKYDSLPASGRIPTDTALTVGLEAAI